MGNLHAGWLSTALATGVLAVGACGQVEYDPPSLVNKLRVLGVRAEPPVIKPPLDTDLKLLAVGMPEGATLCYAWAFCPFAWAKEGQFACVDPDLQVALGTEATARVGIAELLEVQAKVPAVLEKLKLTLPAGLNGPPSVKCGDAVCEGSESAANCANDCPSGPPVCGDKRCVKAAEDFCTCAADCKAPTSFETFVLFQVRTLASLGPTVAACPTDATAAIAGICANDRTCLAGYKRLAVATLPCLAHSNPRILGVKLNGVPWPEAATPTVALGDAVQVEPQLDLADKEVVGPFADPSLGIEKESLLLSWFSTGGTYAKQRTFDSVPGNTFNTPQVVPTAGSLVTLWLVVRDGRNGTAWTSRQMRVQQGPCALGGTGCDKHPLCVLDPAGAGCDPGKPGSKAAAP